MLNFIHSPKANFFHTSSIMVEDDEQRFGRLFQISDSDISIARDEVDKTAFFNLVAQELDRGNRRLGTMVKSFENVRAAQQRLVKEKVLD